MNEEKADVGFELKREKEDGEGGEGSATASNPDDDIFTIEIRARMNASADVASRARLSLDDVQGRDGSAVRDLGSRGPSLLRRRAVPSRVQVPTRTSKPSLPWLGPRRLGPAASLRGNEGTSRRIMHREPE